MIVTKKDVQNLINDIKNTPIKQLREETKEFRKLKRRVFSQIKKKNPAAVALGKLAAKKRKLTREQAQEMINKRWYPKTKGRKSVIPKS